MQNLKKVEIQANKQTNKNKIRKNNEIQIFHILSRVCFEKR